MPAEEVIEALTVPAIYATCIYQIGLMRRSRRAVAEVLLHLPQLHASRPDVELVDRGSLELFAGLLRRLRSWQTAKLAIEAPPQHGKLIANETPVLTPYGGSSTVI